MVSYGGKEFAPKGCLQKKKTLNLYIEERGSGSELCEGAQA